MTGPRKLLGTIAMVYRMLMARTFGEYLHSTGGPCEPDMAIYRWRGKVWGIPTGEISDFDQ